MSATVLDTHDVPFGSPRTRLSQYLKGIFASHPSSNSIQKALKRGEFLVNGQAATSRLWIEGGEKIELLENLEAAPSPYRLPLKIVFEDEHLAVVVKPAGIEVFGKKFRTIQNALIYNLKPNIFPRQALSYPRPVHRLDYATSGLLLVGKDTLALHDLSRQFEERLVQKTYRALVMGEAPEHGVIDVSLEGLPAKTAFRRLRLIPSLKTQTLSLVEVHPETGRTHQIRKHMSLLGHPILGDTQYGPPIKQNLRGKGLFLAATDIGFRHPHTKEMLSFHEPMPSKFEAQMERELSRWNKFRTSSDVHRR